MIELLSGLAAGVLFGWFAHRRAAAAGEPLGVARGPGAHLLPEPALNWLLRADGALGVWIAERDTREDTPRIERTIDERLSIAEVAAIDRRIERARDHEQNGAERLERGTLVFRAAGGVAVGLLIGETPEESQLRRAEQDLTALLDGVRRRPQFVALAQSQSQAGSLESLESVGLRLAYQVERLTGGDVVVVARSRGPTRVVGISGGADSRLKGLLLPPDAVLAQVAVGTRPAQRMDTDPLGGAIIDRRQRRAAVELLPIALGSEVIGAVAIWPLGGAALLPLVQAEVREALAGAASRLARATEADELRDAANRDALTGLLNRRGLELEMGKVGGTAGALIYCDLDEFKRLNDVLGHPAGDAALVHVARILEEQTRGDDIAARLGGEEFGIWLPGANLDLGLRVAERIRIKLSTTEWDWQGAVWPLRASFGVAAVPDTSRRIENLYAQADAALYVAKRSGRDRVEAAGSRPV